MISSRTFLPDGTLFLITSSRILKSIVPTSAGICVVSIPHPMSTPTMFGITLSPRSAVKPITHPAPA